MNMTNLKYLVQLLVLLSITACGGGGGGGGGDDGGGGGGGGTATTTTEISGVVQLSSVLGGRSARSEFAAVEGADPLTFATVELYDADRIDWTLPVAVTQTDGNGTYSLDQISQVNPGSGHIVGNPIPAGVYTIIAYKFDATLATLFVAVQPFVKEFTGVVIGNDLLAIDSTESPEVESMFGLVSRNIDGTFGGASHEVPNNAAIQVTFSTAMARTNLVNSLSITDASDNDVTGTWGISPDLRTATFYPESDSSILDGQLYTVTVIGGDNGATSIYGNKLFETETGSFTAVAVDTTPPNIQLDTPAASTNVPVTTKIIIRANDLLDLNTFNVASSPSIGDKPTILYNGIGTDGSFPFLYEIVPNGNLELDTDYAITLSDARDLAGNTLTTATFNFKTAAVLDETAPTTTASPAGGAYNSIQNVTLSANESPVTISYTLEEESGDFTTGTYSSPIEIATNATLTFYAVDASGNAEESRIEVYTVSIPDTTAPTTTASPAGGVYTVNQLVELSADEDATIYYTTDNTAPTISSTEYSGPIAITGTPGQSDITILRFFAVDTEGNTESAKTEAYTIELPDSTAPTTTASPAGGVYTTAQAVTLTTDETAVIYYTTDGSDPTVGSMTYSSPIAINGSAGSSVVTELRFFALDTAGNAEAIRSETYTINIPDTTAPTTTATPGAGTYTSNQAITLTANEAATIYYSTDGSVPDTSSPVYTSPISITGSEGVSVDTTLRFFAVDTSDNAETPQSLTYTIEIPDTTAPVTTASPVGGTYGNTFSVTLSVNEAATTYYTTDGSNPTTGSSVYSTPIPLGFTTDGDSVEIRFFSVDTEGNSEAIISETYVYDINLNILNWGENWGSGVWQ